MERDFLGLNSKESFVSVKEEIQSDGCKDSGFVKSSGMQWSFSNKVSALPQLMSFKVAQEDKTRKIVSDPPVSTGFMPFSTADAFDPNKNRSIGENQKSFNFIRQGSTQYSLAAYPVQHDMHVVHHHRDVTHFPISSQATPLSMENPFFKNHFATSSQNLAGATMKQQLFGGIPVTASHSILPTIGSVAQILEPCVKASGPPAQLTIFYAGTVNVFDDISPEKAQAIMFLAGNGSTAASHPKAQGPEPNSKLTIGDGVPATQSLMTLPCSGLSSPLSVSSHANPQSGSGSTNTDELMAAKSTVVATATVNNVDAPKVVNAMIPSAVPQARKASLARFLEKRKERAMNASPYNFNKKFSECANPESNA